MYACLAFPLTRTACRYTYEGEFKTGKVEGSGEILWPRKRRGGGLAAQAGKGKEHGTAGGKPKTKHEMSRVDDDCSKEEIGGARGGDAEYGEARKVTKPDWPRTALSDLIIKMKEDENGLFQQRQKDFWQLLEPLRRFQLDRYVEAVREFNTEEERERLLLQAQEVKQEREEFRARAVAGRADALEAAVQEAGLDLGPPTT